MRQDTSAGRHNVAAANSSKKAGRFDCVVVIAAALAVVVVENNEVVSPLAILYVLTVVQSFESALFTFQRYNLMTS
jgi:hypothetical protein